jgi:hypothetical protein
MQQSQAVRTENWSRKVKRDTAIFAGGRAEKTKAAQIRKADFAFSAILFSFLGWALLESWNISIRATPMRHVITTLLGASVMASSLLRFRAYATPAHTEAPRLGLAAAGGFLVLAVIGAVLGTAAATMPVTVVAVVVGGFACFPWSRIGAFKKGLIKPLLSIVLAAGLSFFISHTHLTFMATAPVIWCLWAAATIICLSLCGLELVTKRRRS